MPSERLAVPARLGLSSRRSPGARDAGRGAGMRGTGEAARPARAYGERPTPR